MLRLFFAGPANYLRECVASSLLALPATCMNVSPLLCWSGQLLNRMFRLFFAGPAKYLRECFASSSLVLPATRVNVSPLLCWLC